MAQAIRAKPFLKLAPSEVETNLVWFQVDKSWGSAAKLTQALRENGVLVHASGPQVVRACTHLDVSKENAEQAARVIERLA